MRLSLAYSPCPNDTFMFGPLATGQLSAGDMAFDIHHLDIAALNHSAGQGTYDITKLSVHAWLSHQDTYRLLPVGAAMGFGCGPVVVASETLSEEQLHAASVALPGQFTTAHLLFKLWCPGFSGEQHFVRYDEIPGLVASGKADSGVIIHESRFTYGQFGLVAVRDLGQWWEEKTGLPLPLGCVAAHQRVGEEVAGRVSDLLRESIEAAQRSPEQCLGYMREHAQEMDREILQQHVTTFVNAYSLKLGEEGEQAIKCLQQMARDAGVLS